MVLTKSNYVLIYNFSFGRQIGYDAIDYDMIAHQLTFLTGEPNQTIESVDRDVLSFFRSTRNHYLQVFFWMDRQASMLDALRTWLVCVLKMVYANQWYLPNTSFFFSFIFYFYHYFMKKDKNILGTKESVFLLTISWKRRGWSVRIWDMKFWHMESTMFFIFCFSLIESYSCH